MQKFPCYSPSSPLPLIGMGNNFLMRTKMVPTASWQLRFKSRLLTITLCECPHSLPANKEAVTPPTPPPVDISLPSLFFLRSLPIAAEAGPRYQASKCGGRLLQSFHIQACVWYFLCFTFFYFFYIFPAYLRSCKLCVIQISGLNSCNCENTVDTWTQVQWLEHLLQVVIDFFLNV